MTNEQTKGQHSPPPTDHDIARLTRVAGHYKARDIVLAEWKKGTKPVFYPLVRKSWKESSATEIFD